jgi:hypothetical protein
MIAAPAQSHRDTCGRGVVREGEHEEERRGKCEDIDDPEAGESVRVPHASYDLSSFEMQQMIRQTARQYGEREFDARARVNTACQYAEWQSGVASGAC